MRGDHIHNLAHESARRSVERYVRCRLQGRNYHFVYDGFFRGHPTVSIIRIYIGEKCYTRYLKW